MAVEVAIMLPILLLVSLGIFEYGWIYLKSEEIANAARHGARVGARVDASNADINAGVNGLMSRAGITGYTVTIEPGEVGELTAGQILTVTVTAPYEGTSLELLETSFIPVPGQLRFSVSMAKEGA